MKGILLVNAVVYVCASTTHAGPIGWAMWAAGVAIFALSFTVSDNDVLTDRIDELEHALTQVRDLAKRPDSRPDIVNRVSETLEGDA